MKKLALENLYNEISNYYNSLEVKYNAFFDNLNYKVFFSKLSFDSDIMFLGINPGKGEQVKYYLPLDKLEYVDSEINNYALASQTLKAFDLAGYDGLLEKLDQQNKVLKTNIFYYCDQDDKKIDFFRSQILSKEDEKIFWEKSINWTKEIIKNSNTKIIICEGKLVFDILLDIFNNEESIINIENLRIQIPSQKLVILGYKRRYSNILKIQDFSSNLRIELNKIYNEQN